MPAPVKDDPHWIRRWWERVDKHGPVPDYRPDLGPCWIWTGKFGRAGYGQCNIPLGNGKFAGPAAHRFGYELLVGPIPQGLHLDHLCRVPACVNPAHLEPVTVAENIRRGLLREAQEARWLDRTHCPKGHELTDENRLNVAGCRQCKRSAHRLAGRKRRMVTVTCGAITPKGICQRQLGHEGRHHSQRFAFKEQVTQLS